MIQQRGPPKIQWVGYDGGGKAVVVWRPSHGVVKRYSGCVGVGVAGGVAVSANSDDPGVRVECDEAGYDEVLSNAYLPPPRG